MPSGTWAWSQSHNDYYYYVYDDGNRLFYWARQHAQPAHHNREDSGHQEIERIRHIDAAQTQPGAFTPTVMEPQPAAPVPLHIRQRERHFIAGTPDQGWYDNLDQSYSMRTGAQAREFFKLGRVFAMLYTENAGPNSRHSVDDDAFTVVRFGVEVFSQIRRFVVVSVRRNFVHAWNQGTFKRGCDPGEHALVYNTGRDPETCYFPGEREGGLYKKHIQVYPADDTTYLARESRIRFGKIFSIEWNVKVKDIGYVVDADLDTLISHHNEEDRRWD